VRRGLLLLAIALAAGAASGSAPGQSDSRRLVIRLISEDSFGSANDKAPKGPSPGDTAVSKGVLRNKVAQFGKPAGAIVGRDRATYTIVSTSVYRIDGVATLPGGTIVTRGRVRQVASTGAVAPITGGTGRYARARGTITGTSGGGTATGAIRSTNVYRLTLP
jgi:hypothetical protein